jgi:hypothetical protein
MRKYRNYRYFTRGLIWLKLFFVGGLHVREWTAGCIKALVWVCFQLISTGLYFYIFTLHKLLTNNKLYIEWHCRILFYRTIFCKHNLLTGLILIILNILINFYYPAFPEDSKAFILSYFKVIIREINLKI